MEELFNRRYRIVSSVGRGAQGQTFLAEDTLENNKKVLLKQYSESFFTSRALLEFRQLALLDHPSVVKILHLGTISDGAVKKYYIIEAWVDGKPADAFARELQAKQGDEVFRTWIDEFLLRAASTLHYMHRRGVLHRDIKPAHVLVRGDGRGWQLCFIDFGLAAALGSGRGGVCGTPGYIAPECMKGHYSPLSDLYALGATALAVAGGDLFGGGRAPPHKGNPAELVVRIDDGIIEKLHERLDPFHVEVIRRLVHPDPFERFPSARALADHLIARAGGGKEGADRDSLLSRPAFVGREEIVEGVAASMEKRFEGAGGGVPAAVVLRGPRGVGKSAVAGEIRKKILIRLASKGRGLPVVVESGLEGLPGARGGGALSELVPVQGGHATPLLGEVNSPNSPPAGFLAPMALETGGRSTLRDEPLRVPPSQPVNRLGALPPEHLPALSSPEGEVSGLVDSLLGMGLERTEGVLFMVNNPRRREAEILVRAASILSFPEAARHRLFFIVEWDSDIENPDAERICSAPGVRVVDVPPLPDDKVTELLESALGEHADPSLVGWIAARSGGIPLFAVELAALAASRNFKIGEGDIPGAARQIVDSGLRAAGPRLLDLLKCIALSRTSIDAETASLACGLTAQETLRLLAVLSGKGWLESGRENLELHPLVADAVLASVSDGEQEAVHLKIARALSSRKDDSLLPAMAYHFFMGGDDRWSGKLVEEAGKMEMRHDFEGGLRLLEGALEKSPAGLGDRGKLLAARLLQATGSYDRALATLALLEAPADRELELEKRFEEGALLRLKGRSGEAENILKGLLAVEGLPASLHSKAAGLLGRMLLDSGRHAEALEVVEGALRRGPPDGLRPYLVEPLALSAIAGGNYKKAGEILGEGLEIARRQGALRTEARFKGLLGLACQHERNYAEGTRYYQDAADAAAQSGDIHAFSVYNLNLGSVYMEQGRLALAMEKYNEAIRALESIGGWRELAGALVNAANLRTRAGDTSGARALVERCSRIAVHFDFRATVPLLRMIEGDIAFSEGNFTAAAARYGEAQALFSQDRNVSMAAQAALSKAEACVFAGRPGDAAVIVAEVRSLPGVASDRWASDRAGLVAALVQSEAGGNPEEGIRPAAEALEHFRVRGEKDLALQAQVILLKLFLGAGRRGEAGKHFDGAVAIADGIRREALFLGYDPSGTNPYMKFLRRVVKMKDLSFGPFSREEVSSTEFQGNKWARLARINKRINSELRLRPLLELILDTMIDITQAARGYIILRDAEGSLRIQCARNIDSQRLDEDDKSFSRSIVARVMESASPIITVDAAADDHFVSSKSVVEMNLKSVMAVPLLAKGKVIGAIYVDNPYASNIFSQEDVQILMTFADQAAIALENARLLRENTVRERKIERLNRRLEKLLSRQKVELDAMRETLERSLPREGDAPRRYGELVGESKPMQKVFRMLDRIVETDLPAVIIGESGTGKELVARAIHFGSARRSSPFVTENCGAIPDALLESVLFGHLKGAFTGADRSRPGLFEMANRGTLFLDEIDSMSLPMQTKLLRTLQDGVIRPLGGELARRVDVRVLAATGTRLDRLVGEGKFREDLYYRINVISLELPPLRERKEDVPLLVSHFIGKHSGGRKIEVSRGAMKKLMDYDWPGNVRQLENEIMRAIVLSEGRIMEDVLLQDVPAGPEGNIDVSGSLDLNENVEKVEKVLIGAALVRTGGNQSAAARMLGVSRFGLIKKMARYGIAKP